MHLPTAYQTTDTDKINHFIKTNNFADLVTVNNGNILSNKVPFYFDSIDNCLYGHFGKHNNQLKDIKESNDALVIFSGANCYVSPQWYASKNNVPTWNFQTLQIRGPATILNENDLFTLLENLTALHEAKLPAQWTMGELDSTIKEKLVQLIVGFKIEIEDIKFKEKLSQIRQIKDQQSIMNALYQQNNPNSSLIASLMESKLEKV